MTPERLSLLRQILAVNDLRQHAQLVRELVEAHDLVLHEVEYLRHENAHLMKLLPEEAFPIYTSEYALKRTATGGET